VALGKWSTALAFVLLRSVVSLLAMYHEPVTSRCRPCVLCYSSPDCRPAGFWIGETDSGIVLQIL
jgi:hypothetical protein